MIRASFYRSEMRELKALYGDGVLYTENGGMVLVKNFKPPQGYECNKTYLVFEIPSGFGFGVNIQQTWILLRKSAAHFHLINSPKDIPYIEKSLDEMGVKLPKDYGKEWRWFWICFHTAPPDVLNPALDAIAAESSKIGVDLGDTAATAVAEKSTGDKDAEDPMTKQFAKYVGFTEHTKLVALALTKILNGDPVFMRELDAMNRGREDIINRQKERLDAFEFSNNWRNVKWVWD